MFKKPFRVALVRKRVDFAEGNRFLTVAALLVMTLLMHSLTRQTLGMGSGGMASPALSWAASQGHFVVYPTGFLSRASSS